ncbi:MAG: efflux RND transporter periplasmic adaptor subunit [Pseudomonadales bacterium]
MVCLLKAVFVVLVIWHTPALAQESAGAPIRTVVVETQAITEIVQLTGTVTSLRDSNLSAATSGVVTKLHVDSGSQVNLGDVLLELDSELARWQWQGARADVKAAEVGVTDTRRRLEEARELLPQRSISQSAVSDLVAEFAASEAALEQATAEASYRKALLERHTVRAPFSGLVQNKHTEIGEWVVPGNPVLSLVETNNLSLDFQVAENYLPVVNKNTLVKYWLGNDRQTSGEGRVETIVRISAPGARTFLVRVQAKAADPRMIPGKSARGELLLDTGRQALVVPRDAVVKRSDGQVLVWAVERLDGRAVVQERPISTGLHSGGMVEILSGLQAGAEVVTQGNESLMIGQRVHVLH